MPAYNPGPRILDAVRSILNQTFLEWQLIVLDDGSTDGSLSLIAHLSDPRIKVVTDKENRGLPYRLNQGIGMATGKYIVRMDADDISFPTRFQKQFTFLEDHPNVDLLASRAVVFKDTDFSLIGLLPFFNEHPAIVASPWRSIPMPHPTWMAKTSWFKENRYEIPEVRRAEDQELLLRTYPASQFHCLPEVLLAYRQGAFNLSKTWIARKSLANIQVRYFFIRRQWAFLIKSMVMFLLKIVLDFVSAIPGMDFIFFHRMGRKVPVEITNQFLVLVNDLRNDDYVEPIKKT